MRRSLLLGAAGVVLTLTFAPSAQALVRISDDPGGLMSQYATRFMSVRDKGENVVIDGPCYSACTMVLGYVPRQRVCVTENAVLGFHAAWQYDSNGRQVPSSTATRALNALYPPQIRQWLAQRGGLSPEMKFLRGRELASMYPACGQNEVVTRSRSRVNVAGVPLRRANARAERGGFNSR